MSARSIDRDDGVVRCVAVNGVELACYQRGEGTPFVLLHGWTGSARGWAGVVDHLAASRRVIAIDHRGHGRSTNTGDAATYTFDQLVDDVEALVDAIGLGTFHLLGHSMGGVVAMRYALRHPTRLRSLVLMDTGAGRAPGSGDLMQPLIDIVLAGGTAAYYTAAEPYVGAPGPEGDAFRAAFKWEIDHVDPVAFVTFAKELTTFESVLGRLAWLRLPTTVMVGENDLNLRGEAANLAHTIPGAVLEVVPDAAHSPQVENRTEWLAIVDRHLARTEAPATTGVAE